jgi:hypothetical protein
LRSAFRRHYLDLQTILLVKNRKSIPEPASVCVKPYTSARSAVGSLSQQQQQQQQQQQNIETCKVRHEE